MTLPTRCTIGICSKGSCPVFSESKSFLADEINPIFAAVIEQIFHFESCWRKFKRESSPYNEPIGVFLLLVSFFFGCCSSPLSPYAKNEGFMPCPPSFLNSLFKSLLMGCL